MKFKHLFTILFLLETFFVPVVYGFVEIEIQVEVNSIIDGVTFTGSDNEVFKLADLSPTCTDIDNSTGFISSKNLLSSLILGKTVFLDSRIFNYRQTKEGLRSPTRPTGGFPPEVT